MQTSWRHFWTTKRYGRDARGAVSIVFATAVLPLIMSVGLAIDYSFYVEAQAQLNLAADAGAMHAVRLASAHFTAGDTPAVAGQAGALAGKQWFAAQAGLLPDGNTPDVVVPPVSYDASTSTFTATVNYTGKVTTHFAGLFAIPSWPIGGTASAVITTKSFSQFDMLIDNSSSMLIGATPADILKIQNLTICAPTAVAQSAAQSVSAYSWNFNAGGGGGYFGYGSHTLNGNTKRYYADTIPLKSPVMGSCDPNFTGAASQCVYPPAFSAINANGFCPTQTGIPDGGNPNSNPPLMPRTDSLNNNRIAMLPQAPCGFACHTGDGINDFYTLVRHAQSSDPSLMLRFDVIQAAAAQVVNTLAQKVQVTGVLDQFSLGVYEFKDNLTRVYPEPGSPLEADINLTQAMADIGNIVTPIVADLANTDFPGAMANLVARSTSGGDGSSPTTRRKNLFIITDGLQDFPPSNGRTIGPMTRPAAETVCAPMKALGFNIFVLYTPYYPLPNPFYLSNGNNTARMAVEPTVPPALSNPVIAALQACASNASQYYQASDSASIGTALQKMLLSALNTSGRISQ